MIIINQQNPFPAIETDRLILRQLLTDDATILLQYWSAPEVTEYLTLEPFKKLEEAVAMIELLNSLPESNQGIRWAITSRQEGKVLGTCGFHNYNPEHCRAEMGYELGQAYWRQGFMTEALTAILHYGFEKMAVNRIEAFVNVGNIKSTGTLEKMGFKLDGLLREYEFARGKFVDQYCYSLLKSDY
ncbi:Putative ribosomal N-acetyltransferase YdaF [Sporomusa ovata DSM 2662]|uniref:GNAT family acetyltransferase Bsu1853 (YoaA) n=1 Tax=Sporomusa ovata TaxID=2378 RepID=A0A0U1KVA5_9FIRM|nr:GNAT family protein [Sporomusa ovata]EQB26739.1 acetyltransferase, GNAT family [Sporomusa ovata DSM 2662]CQR70833.1 GNAT family acetyltransferase Bsu1853 (YoaA) [Sporomusa ovata]